jgi:hypothetical protein
MNANDKKREELKKIIEETLKRTLTKGFYGKVGFSLFIENGTIQKIERNELEKYK